MKNNLPRAPSKQKLSVADRQRTEVLYTKISGHIEQARQQVQRAINVKMIKAYWMIGKEIVEEEQQGKARVAYGKTLLFNLASRLTEQYGKGFSVRTLEDIRKFYLTYQVEVQQEKSHAVREIFNFNPNLSWTHYRLLMRIDRNEARSFYEKEAIENNWSAREQNNRKLKIHLFNQCSRSPN